MIPVFWRYALGHYAKIFCLSLGSIVSLLIVSRFKEIAEFAVSATGSKTALFTLYQIPFIFPMAFPISALLASFLFVQKMSQSHETTALRAAGLSLRHIFAPILFFGGFLSLINFCFSASVAPACFRESVRIIYPDTSNPLAILQKRKMLKLKHAYLQLKEKEGEIVDLLLIARGNQNHRLELFSAPTLRSENEQLMGERTAFVSQDPLFIENHEQMSMDGQMLAKFFLKRPPKTSIRSLDFRLLHWASTQKNRLGRYAWIELLRRSSLSLAVFTFTFLGCAFGLEPDKKGSKNGALFSLLLALLLLSSYFLGKGLRFHATIAFLSFLFPHCLIWIVSCWRMDRITKGLAT